MVGMSYQHKSPITWARLRSIRIFLQMSLNAFAIVRAATWHLWKVFKLYVGKKSFNMVTTALFLKQNRGLRKGRKNWFAAYPMKFLSLCVNNTIYVSGWVLVGWVLRIWRHLCEQALRWKSWPQILSPLATTISSLNHWFRMLKIAQTPALMI